MKTEKDLFEQITRSNEGAFEILFRLYFEPLVRFCDTYLKDKDLSKGITQQVFISIWENRKNLPIQSPGPYLYKSVKNKCLNHIRHQGVRNDFEDFEKHKETSYEFEIEEPNDQMIQIQKSIDKLSPECKRIFIMSRMNDLSHKEIAEELGITVKTVKNQIGKALKKLRNELSHLNIALIICALQFIEKNL